MNRPKHKKVTKQQLIKEVQSLESYRELYTKAVYSIMEIRHALGDTDAKWSHPEVVKKIEELKKLEPEIEKSDSP